MTYENVAVILQFIGSFTVGLVVIVGAPWVFLNAKPLQLYVNRLATERDALNLRVKELEFQLEERRGAPVYR